MQNHVTAVAAAAVRPQPRHRALRSLSLLLCLLMLQTALLSGCAGSGSGTLPAPQTPSAAADISSAPATATEQPKEPSEEGSGPQESLPVSGDTADAPGDGSRVLVAYFSCTGNTEGIAVQIAEDVGADLYEILPEEPYTDADLDYGDSESRTSLEQNDDTARPAISGSVENMEEYGTIFLGYPIWWGQAPKILYTFLETYDLAGKTIVPFCTSGSSGIGSSADNLQASAPDAVWLEGHRFSGSASGDIVSVWIAGLGLNLSD